MPATPEGTKEMMRFEYGRFTTPHTVGELRHIVDKLSPQVHAIIVRQATEYSGIQQIVDALRGEDDQQLPRHLVPEINALLSMIEREEKMDAAEKDRQSGVQTVKGGQAVLHAIRTLFGLF